MTYRFICDIFSRDRFYLNLKGGGILKTIAIINQKGGVGKTTSVINLGAALTKLGKRVLLIDLDPQGSLSGFFGFDEIPDDQPTTFEVLTGKSTIKQARLRIADKYDLVLLDDRIIGEEDGLVSRPDILRSVLEPVTDQYDYCLIDCNPSLGALTIIALTASDSTIVPTEAQLMAIKGLSKIIDTVTVVQESLNPGLKIGGVILTKYDARRTQDKIIEEEVRKMIPETFRTPVKVNSKIAEAAIYQRDVLEHDPKGPGASAYMSIAKELLEREKGVTQ